MFAALKWDENVHNNNNKTGPRRKSTEWASVLDLGGARAWWNVGWSEARWHGDAERRTYDCTLHRTTNYSLPLDRGAESLMNQGKEWEKKGEYNRAIEMYMKITPSMTTDHDLVEDAMVKVTWKNRLG